MLPQFFIDRPVFAWVIAILITLMGIIAVTNLPIEAYPEIAPPQVNVNATYPGANADTVERAVTQVIEQQLTGIDNLLYFTSSSSSNGGASITLTFESGTDVDIAAVQTQNRVALAEPRLPTEVIQQGISIQKANAGFIMAVALRSDDGALDSFQLNNVLASRVLEQLERIPGVGSVNQFGSEFAMRIWLNPDRLQAYRIAAKDVLDTVRGQNVQFASGSVGSLPAVPNQPLSVSVVTEGRFTTPEQFENIILRAEPNGTTVRLKDVATVNLAPASYGRDIHVNDTAIAGAGILLLPGADALKVAELVRAKMDELKPSFPPGVSWFTPFDATTFILISAHEVVYTLIAAVVLVFIVMLVFLQSFRATIIPTLVMPVALLGAFIGMYLVGFSINLLSLFGVVLAIGIVVDDAIVVIEAVERIMREEHLPPKEATRKAMGEITGAIITITVVLSAVFVPAAMQSGSVGAIYRQFALTIAISMIFSAFLALTFTPALCATLLRPTHLKPNPVFRLFNRVYERSQNAYVKRVYSSVAHTPRWMAAFAVMVVLMGLLYSRLPGSFLPEEDQGYALAIVQLPPGSTLERTNDVMSRMGKVLRRNEAVFSVTQVAGFSFVGQGENVGLGFIRLKHWDDRDSTALEFIQWGNQAVQEIKDAQIFIVNLPTIRGLSAFGGFDLYLEDRTGQGREALAAAKDQLVAKAAQNPALTGTRANTLEDAPRVRMTVDRVQAEALGISVSDVYTALQLMLAPVYANDFFYEGRVMRVLLQAEAPYRMSPDSLSHFYVPSSQANGGMIPLSNVVSTDWVVAPPAVTRYNGFPAIEITGSNAPGRSSGEAMDALQNIIETDLPDSFGFDWAGQSLQEILSGNRAPMLFALSILVVYLCLAALYESWAIPVAVMLVVPVGVFGAVIAAMLRGLPNDVFFKVGLITIIGLSAKNAILIVEFAVTQQLRGKSLHDAVLEGSRLRFRPILMTSFAFILGVMPLVVSTGAGANARHAIGTGVVGGMLAAALLGVLLVPVFYTVVRRLMGDRLDEPTGHKPQPPEKSPAPGTA
jgi:multidrug efflux pump